MGSRFETTSWSLIIRAAGGEDREAREALARLCETYWPAVYALIRGKGHSPSQAQDLTQGYFARFLEKDVLRSVRREAGSFRAFLRVSVRHFLSNERDRERAQKRGGGRAPLSLDAGAAEERYRWEPVERVTPEDVFERQWAVALLSRCLARLRAEQRGAGNARFDALQPLLVDGPADGYAGLAARLGTTEQALRVAVHRMRRRFGAILREEVARTLGGEREGADPGQVDAEIRWLLTRLA